MTERQSQVEEYWPLSDDGFYSGTPKVYEGQEAVTCYIGYLLPTPEKNGTEENR